jgi:hypothetical protein
MDRNKQMKKFSAKVIETATVIKLYVVEAEDQDEALELLESGETEEEVYLKDGEVINRVVETNTIEEHPLTFSAELPFNGSHAPDCPYHHGGECLCWRSDPKQNPVLDS